MRKILLLAGVACVVATSASASNSAFNFNPYVAAKAKYALSRTEVKATGTFEGKDKLNDNVFGGAFAVGTTYPVETGHLRFELEYTKNADAEKKQAKVKSQAVLFNVYYDFNVQTTLPITPYIGVGMGWGQSEIENNGARIVKDDSVSMQIGGGINYKINEHVVVDLGYRYMDYGDFEEEYRVPGVLYEKFDYEPHAHEFLLGVRYEF
ncbi:MAG: porin family protein [Alphaproteobacteria bacterium]|nr:porin family protein [Alphaproteobacteria bacterium]